MQKIAREEEAFEALICGKDILFLKHDSRILRHCWDVSKVSSSVFLTSSWAFPLLLLSAQIMA